MTENQMDEIKRYFNVVAEGLQHEIRLIAEGHGVLRQEIQDTRHDLNEKLNLNTSLIKTVHDSLDSKIGAIRDELKTDIAAVGDKVDGHETRIQHLGYRAA